MSKLKINKNKFLEFLNLASLRGSIENREILLDIKKDSISTQAVSHNRIVSFRGTIKEKSSDWGEIGIDNLTLIKNFINTLTEENIELTKKENRIVLKLVSGTFSSTLRSPEYIMNHPSYMVNPPPKELIDKAYKSALGNLFTLKEDVIGDIVNKCQIINCPDIIISGENKKITLTLANDNDELTIDYKIDKEVKKFKTKVSNLILDIISVTSDDVSFSINNNCPIYIKAGNDCKFEYLIKHKKL